MRRRDFLTLLGGAAGWPFAARAQQPERMRRVAVVMQYVETDAQGQLRAAAFREGLEKAGWVSGRNISVNYLWGVMDSEWSRGIIQAVGPMLKVEVIPVDMRLERNGSISSSRSHHKRLVLRLSTIAVIPVLK
jgi:hypothetical protein